MLNWFRQTASLLLCGVVGIICINAALAGSGTPDATVLKTKISSRQSVFVQLFEWRWDDIALECEQFLGPAGYSAVQISPPNEHVDQRSIGNVLEEFKGVYPWWVRYQPVSFKLISRSGNAAQFSEMVQRCKAVGVGIYADTVVNHMANLGDHGVAGTPFNRKTKNYRDYTSSDFHPDCVIQQQDYSWSVDQQERQLRALSIHHCQLGDLPDLRTESNKVRQTIQTYYRQLVALGVSGLRIDAAKHMSPQDIAAVISGLEDDIFVFQEVIDSGDQPVSINDYVPNAHVTEFRYSQDIGNIFIDGKIAELANFNEQRGFVPNQKAVVFIDNHDNQRGHGMEAKLNHRSGQLYDLANVFMLAWPYGYPKVMSSYEWGGVNDNLGPPHDGQGNTLPVYRSDGSMSCANVNDNAGHQWLCEHRRPIIANMVAFRSAMQNANASSVTNWWDNGNNRLAFALSDQQHQTTGFVVINRQSEPLVEKLYSGLKPGTYCDITRQPLFKPIDQCMENQHIIVNHNGTAQFDVAPMSAMVIAAYSLLH